MSRPYELIAYEPGRPGPGYHTVAYVLRPCNIYFRINEQSLPVPIGLLPIVSLTDMKTAECTSYCNSAGGYGELLMSSDTENCKMFRTRVAGVGAWRTTVALNSHVFLFCLIDHVLDQSSRL